MTVDRVDHWYGVISARDFRSTGWKTKNENERQRDTGKTSVAAPHLPSLLRTFACFYVLISTSMASASTNIMVLTLRINDSLDGLLVCVEPLRYVR